MSPLEQVKGDLVSAIAAVFPGSPVSADDITPTPSPALGDLAIPVFKFAKLAGKNPGTIAEDLRERIAVPASIASFEVAGPYLNVRLNRLALTKATLGAVSRARSAYGNGRKTRKRVMVEYVSPNMNKPLHLGHLRTAWLGESVARLLTARGETVIRAQLQNDRGVGISKAMVAYERWGKRETPASAGVKGDHLVGKYYVLFEEKRRHDPSLEGAAQESVRKWEENDRATRALWRTMMRWCASGHAATYKTIGIRFDKSYLESALYKLGKRMVEQGLAKGIFVRDEKGNVIAKLPGMPEKVVLRADGTAVYITTDLALTVEKMEKARLSRSLWVVGNEQNLNFRQLFAILRIMGYRWVDSLEHVSYGLVFLPSGRMKSREGTVVDADELLASLAELAAEAVRERHDFLDRREVEKRALEIAMGAVRFYLLEASAATDIVFDPKESLAFTGKTGPYLQYTNARILSVLRKAANRQSHAGRIDASRLTEEAEWRLILALAAFPETVAAAASDREPSTLAKYCYALAKSFSEFYESVPVLQSEDAVRRARLGLLRAVQIVLARGLDLLGIPAPKEM